jgi:hypothetical protein
LVVSFLAGAAGCTGDANPHQRTSAIQPIPCSSTADCVSRGGTCVDGTCQATNQCSSVGDCPADQICAPDPNFGGLCTAANSPSQAQPAWACSTGKDCPRGQGCSSDKVCHVDGECLAADGINPDQGCPAGLLCYNAGNDTRPGFCGAPRPSSDPYCRSDGQGACRVECESDGTCLLGGTCVGGFCHPADECGPGGTCSLSFVCQPTTSGEDFGYSTCVENPNVTCVSDPAGVCRLRCQNTKDCVWGGECQSDGFCHASNECNTDSDCPNGESCYPVQGFSGICGAPR